MGGSLSTTSVTGNPYIHGTTSATLGLMKNTEFQLMPIIPMLTQYRVAPMVGELFQGGYRTIGKDIKSAEMIGAPAFGKVHSSHYDLKRIASDYAKQNGSLTKEQAAQHVKEFVAISHRCAFSNLNLLMISVVRYQQLGGEIKSLLTIEECELFNKRLDAAIQFYYFVACMDHYIFMDVEALDDFKVEYQLQGDYAVGDYIRHFYAFEKILEAICINPIDIEMIFKNPTTENIQNLIEYFKVKVGSAEVVERYLSESDNFVASKDHYFFSNKNNNHYNQCNGVEVGGYFFNNMSGYSLVDYLETYHRVSKYAVLAECYPFLPNFYHFQQQVINYIEVFKQRSKECSALLKSSNAPLCQHSDPLIAKSFPIIFVSYDQSIQEYLQEYRSAKPLKLGHEICLIATKTLEDQKRTRDYLQENHIGPVEVILFNDLENGYQNLQNEIYALAYAIARKQGIEKQFCAIYRALDELNQECQHCINTKTKQVSFCKFSFIP